MNLRWVWPFLLYFLSLLGHDYQLGVVMIFRDEAPYLKEWIEYHRVVGVEHFWLFNNLSKDGYEEILKPYIEAGVVDLIDVNVDSPSINRWNALQTRCYNRGIGMARGKCKWLGVIDADEFIVPVEELTIPLALKRYEAYPAVALHWMIFGTSFVEKIPEGMLMCEVLTLKGDSQLDENRYVKLVVQPERSVGFNGPHMCTFKEGTAVNTDFIPLKQKQSSYATHQVLRINHYWSRDINYLVNVKIPRSRISGGAWARHMEKEITKFNKEPDDLIFRFLPILKARMCSSTP